MSQGQNDLETAIASLDLLDPQNVDWERVHRTAYLIHQHLRYEYPGPVHDLSQLLMIVPPEQYGDQRRVVYRLEVSTPPVEIATQFDEFGNLVLNPLVRTVEQAIDFEAWIVVERRADSGPHYIDASWLTDARLLQPSRQTQPDDVLREVAASFGAAGLHGLELARRINSWAYHALQYENGVTTIRTTATEALKLGRGVCQDFAHIMLTLCRLCHLPARYVSGHMLGEGGTHAWVEVLLPVAEHPDKALVVPFDPTHERETSLSYITIAVGCDYFDVAPTSGSFRASYSGQLSARKRVDLTVLEYADASTKTE